VSDAVAAALEDAALSGVEAVSAVKDAVVRGAEAATAVVEATTGVVDVEYPRYPWRGGGSQYAD
jgi:hypothetical protein